MKYILPFLLLIMLGSCTDTTAQGLHINFNSGATISYGVATIERITFSSTDMEVHLWGGSLFSYGIDSIQNYRYTPTFTSHKQLITRNTDGFYLYPNPSSDLVKIEFVLLKDSSAEILVYNSTGSLIFEQTKVFKKGNNQEVLNLIEIGLNTGIYFIELRTAKKQFIKKLMFNN